MKITRATIEKAQAASNINPSIQAILQAATITGEDIMDQYEKIDLHNEGVNMVADVERYAELDIDSNVYEDMDELDYIQDGDGVWF